MNFLSHFFFDSKGGNPYYNLGLILPDLMGMFRRGWKIPESEPPETLSVSSLEIYRGLNTHHSADAFFHNSKFFKKYTRQLKRELTRNGIQNPHKPFFIAHVMLEVLIDRNLIKQDERLPEHFYKDLDFITKDSLVTFFNETDKWPEGFWDLFQKFRTERYAYAYLDPKKVIYTLNRILDRARQPVIEESEWGFLNYCIFEMDERLSVGIEELKLEYHDYKHSDG